MKRKQILSRLMAVLMVGCLLAGCGQAGTEALPDGKPLDSPTEEPADREPAPAFSFETVSKLEFWFGSGAGAWHTVLTVQDDGTFEGEYLDSDTNVQYLCNFTGKFTEPEKVNDYTYSVRLERIDLAQAPDTEETKGEIRVVYSEPYGLENAEELLFYLPGAPVQALPEEYRGWMGGYGDSIGTELPFYGLYNVRAETGFSSHERPTVDEELASAEQAADALESKLHTESLSQGEMNETAAELYQIWDAELNALWGQLKKKLDTPAMQTLTAKQLEWIAYKESEIQKAGAPYEGGTLRPLVENGRGAELTKARVYELAELLKAA